MTYGRFWWVVEDQPPVVIYCSKCQLVVAPFDRFKVVVGDKTFHGDCFVPAFTYIKGGA